MCAPAQGDQPVAAHERSQSLPRIHRRTVEFGGYRAERQSPGDQRGFHWPIALIGAAWLCLFITLSFTGLPQASAATMASATNATLRGHAQDATVPASGVAPVASDPQTGRIFIGDPNADLVRIISSTGSLIGQPIDIGGTPIALAFDNTSNTLFVATRDPNNAPSGTISAIDLAHHQLIGAVALPGRPAGLTYDALHQEILIPDADGSVIRVLSWPDGNPLRSIIVAGASVSPSSPPGINPPSGPPKSSILIWAGGFNAGERVTVNWGLFTIASGLANSEGAVYVHFRVPPNATPGKYPIIVYGPDSGTTRSLYFTAVPAPKIVPPTPSPLAGVTKTARKLLSSGPLAKASSAVFNLPLPAGNVVIHLPVGGKGGTAIPVILLIALPLLYLIVRMFLGSRKRRRAKRKQQEQQDSTAPTETLAAASS